MRLKQNECVKQKKKKKKKENNKFNYDLLTHE